jgi:pimeloyl-ACP methyl ester carboxylesterase
MTTVLGLEPAFFSVMGVWMKKYAKTEGRTFARVRYPNIPTPNGGTAKKGMDALDSALHRYPGPKVVFGHSMGAQVACKWLRERGPTSDISPSEVTFLLCGNPERKFGGALMVQNKPKYNGVKLVAAYGGPGIPDATPYAVVDYARQYDFWADAPTTANPGIAARSVASQVIHCNYFFVGLNDPDVLTYTQGNRIYKLKPSPLGAAMRNLVENSYQRPTG